jgi:hypothetical protein
MQKKTSPKNKSLVFPSMLAISLSLMAGCAHKPAEVHAPIGGSNCYAKAMPTAGEGGLAWGANLKMAGSSAMDNCRRYADRSGGTPNTCQVVEARCNK